MIVFFHFCNFLSDISTLEFWFILIHQENTKSKQMCTESEAVKFGTNISHLAQYSGIAEKSMEKFVSIISSFKFSSSGSRASGLRAPLKDIRNTSTNRWYTALISIDFYYNLHFLHHLDFGFLLFKRLTTCVDFSQFAYAAPKDRKSWYQSRS